jgi:ABC-type lipoprotein export system ATPase subunit
MYKKGSEWRKWDLHVHTASSYDAGYNGHDVDELLVKAWRDHEIAAVAITDHFLIDAKRIKKLRDLAPEITIFPGFEMRTDKGAPNLHVIGIFSETCDVDTLKDDFDAIIIRNHKKEDETNETIVRDLSVIVDFVKRHKGILTIHAGGKTNGIDKEITNALEVAQAIKKDIASVIDIFEIGQVKDIAAYNEHVFKIISEKPLIICSDNHDPRDYKIKEYLWIKANPTFQGLIQTIMQPTERVFVGIVPDKLDRLSKNKSAHIKSITIERVTVPKNGSENWFDTTLLLNPALVAVIGNKGSGKSALSDIIGHLCKASNMGAASFLNSERFRRLPEKKADDYNAKIEWYDGKAEEGISLGEIQRETTLEEAQYLPQKYIERVCNDLSSEFQNEIDKVIFSYVDSTEKGDATNLGELIENKSRSIQIRIAGIKNQIDLCNKDLIRLEDRKTATYKAAIIANLNKRREDFERHNKNKPTEIEQPKKTQDAEYEKRLSEIKASVSQLEEEERRARDELRSINIRIDQNNEITDSLSSLSERITSVQEQILKYANTYALNSESLSINVTLPIDEIKSDFKALISRKEALTEALNASETASEITLAMKIQSAKQQLEAVISGADSAERFYQKYLVDIKEWGIAQNEIIGDITKEGSISYYESELNYIENALDRAYEEKMHERVMLVRKIFEQKKQIAEIYKDLYRPIEKQLIPLLENSEDKIEFNISIALREREIGTQLLSYINQQMIGVFKGKAEASAMMKEYIQSADFNDCESIIGFLNNVLKCVSEDFDKSSQKVKEKLDFYNLLFSLDYIKAEYNLTLGGRQLAMLSAGERGIVLLVFYLALSKNDVPLIIDQPEDNLDNQSVFSRLVPCIREAKKKRQVIIVTHNPNIAIACDAEQIVCCSIRKADNHISYSAGSIEDRMIRKCVVDILEGTMPAFELRKLKYTYGLYENE